MDKKLIKQVLKIIKEDNEKEFSAQVKKQENFLHACFGRFPLLSVLYLFNANKILKAFETQLISINEFNKEQEDFEIYKKFKTKAGKLIRIYGENEIVLPLEMLYILNEISHLKIVFEKTSSKFINLEKLNKISVMRTGKEIVLGGKNLLIPKVENKTNKKLLKISAIVCLLVVIISCFLALVTINLGTKENPYIISNEKQFQLAISNNEKYYKLANNIEVSSISNTNSSCNINGQGYIVTIKNVETAIFNEFSGTLENITFNFASQEKSLVNNYSYLTNVNKGTIKNVEIVANGLINYNEGNVLNYVSVFTEENKGVLDGCKLLCNLEITNNARTDVFFSGFAGKNFGEIKNCQLLENSIIKTNTLDVCGISAENFETGIIDNCSNNGKISQQTNKYAWNPHVAGVSINNFGTIKNCYNNAELKINVTSTKEPLENLPESYLGGIVCINYNTVEKCKNTANLEVNTTQNNAYLGGVVSFNNVYNQIPIIKNCASTGKLTIQDNNEKGSYLGGIVSISAGYVKNCYSIISHENSEKVSIGGIVGLTHYGAGHYAGFVFVYTSLYNEWYENNHFFNETLLNLDNNRGIGAITPAEYVLVDYGMNAQNSIEKIEQSEVWW